MTVSDFVAARDRLLSLDADDLNAVLNASLAALHEVTRFHWAAVMAVDPHTILPAAGVVEGFDTSSCGPFWDCELVSPGYNKFAELSRRHDPVATLVDATDGDLRRSPAYVELYGPLGAADELRVAFVQGATCWGIASLLRTRADGPFPEAEVDAVRQLSRFVAKALRQVVVRSDSRPPTAAGMLVVDRDNSIAHATVDARLVLEDLRGVEHLGTMEASDLPGMLLGLVVRARSNPAGAHVATRVRALSGTWMRVTAARTDFDDGHVALVIEPARATDLVPMVLEGFGLTQREVEIVGYLARGLTSREIAAEVSLSAHTVRDHVKAILRKCGASSRGELVARLFADHIRPSFEAAVVHAAPPALPRTRRPTATDH